MIFFFCLDPRPLVEYQCSKDYGKRNPIMEVLVINKQK